MWSSTKQSIDATFAMHGPKMKINSKKYENDSVIHLGVNRWNTCFSSFIITDYMQIELKINQLTRRDGICIGFSSSTESLNKQFFFPCEHFKSIAFKSDGKRFCNGTYLDLDTKSNGFKNGDNIHILIVCNSIKFNEDEEVFFDNDFEYKLAISIYHKYDSVSILNVKQLNKKDITRKQQKILMDKMNDKLKCKDHLLNKEWYDLWNKYIINNITHPSLIDNGQLTQYKQINLKNRNMDKTDNKTINLVFGYLHFSYRYYNIPNEIIYICLQYHGSSKMNRYLWENKQFIYVHKYAWNLLQRCYGGGPIVISRQSR